MFRKLHLPRLVALLVIVLFAALPAAAMPMATSPTLGNAESYLVLAGSTVTNTGTTTIAGDVGVSAGSAITGFPPGIVLPPGTIHAADAHAALAQAASVTAFGALEAGANAACDTTYADAQNLSGLTLVPGTYCFPTSAHLLTGVALTLDAENDPGAVWIFRTGSTLITAPGVDANVTLVNGALPCNVWWRVGSSATLGSGTSFVGNVLALASISLGTGATLEGRALAQTGAVTLDTNTITAPFCTPTAVELLYFHAERKNDDEMRLTWATALEVDNFGFRLYRANANDFAQAEPIGFVGVGEQGNNAGATYFYDDAAPVGSTYYYWLADVDTRDKETIHTVTVDPAQVGSQVYLPFMSSE